MTPPATALNRLSRYHPLPLLLAGLVVLTLYRGWVFASVNLSLYFDEAYYWFWSTDLAYGYFSKPPMIAWVIRLMTSTCGESETCIRGGALLLFPVTTLLVYGIAAKTFDRRIGFWAALAFTSLPVVSFYSRVMTTDSLLLFYWALALFGFVQARQHNRWRDWLLMGLGIGGGLLSKYTMGFFLLSLLLYCIFESDCRTLWRNPKLWAGLGLAAALFAPNLVWNQTNGFASFKHTAEIAKWNGDLFHPDKFFEFVGGQFLLFGPVLALALLVLALRQRDKLLHDPRIRLPLAFSVPMLLIYTVQSLVARANLNWAAAAYVPGAIVAAAYFSQVGWMRLFKAGLLVNLLLGIGTYHYVEVAQSLGFKLSRKLDMYTELKGWRELGAALHALRRQYPDAGLLCDNRRVLSELIYYSQPHPLDAAIYNPSGQISDHFRLTADVSRSPHLTFIFVAADTPPADFSAHFAEVTDLGSIEAVVHDDYVLKYRVYHVKRFLGYGL